MTISVAASQIAHLLDSALIGADITVTNVQSIGMATKGSLTFATSFEKYADSIVRALSDSALVLIPAGGSSVLPALGTMIEVQNPRYAFAIAVAAFAAPPVTPGVAATARVHPSASVHPMATVGEFSVVREGAKLGAFCEVRDHVVIGREVEIGEHSLIKSHVVIGEEGFGIEKDPEGNNFRIPHIGSVRIGRHVEIGAFSTVCSGTISPTEIGEYTKTDDHVHVAHNARVGKNVLILAGAKISGSVVVEDEVWVGPNTVTIDGATLGRNSQLGMGGIALKSIPANEIRMGNPARRIGDRLPRSDT